MGRLLSVKIENFKSYPGTQVIGPFKDFTAVIGPNGSGKSNLMDAISFVLGVQSRQLRSNQMKELIFRADDLAPGKRRASVELIYQVSEDELEGYEDGQKVSFKRTISPTGVGSYRLNDREVTGEVYENTLKQIGVLVKARNFLVFQGDVESIAQKAPKDLTQLFEQISGSEEVKEEYDEARRLKDEADENTIFAYQKKKAQTAEKRQVKEQKEEAERYNAKIEELAGLTTDSYLYQLYHVKTELDSHHAKVESMRNEVKAAEDQEAKLDDDVAALKREQAALHKEASKAEKEVKKRREKVEALAPSVIREEQALKSLRDKLHEEKTAGLKLKADWQENKDKKKGLQEDIQKCEETEEAVRADMEKAQEEQKGKGVIMTGDRLKEYNGLKQQVAAKTNQAKAQLQALQRQQAADQSEEEVKRREQELHENTVAQAEAEIKQQEAKAAQLSADVAKRTEERQSLEAELTQLESKQRRNEDRLTQVRSEIKTLEELQRQHKHEKRQSQAEERMVRAIEEMKDMYPGVKGRLVDLCRPMQRKWGVAVSVAGGRLMDAIVTDTKATAAECIRHLREQRVGVADFIPLSGIKNQDVVDRYRSLGKGYRLAVDVVECEDEIRPALVYALGASTVICDTLEGARDLCFKRNEQVKAVTESGAVIAKDGTMTGGRLEGDGDRKGGGGTMAKWDAKDARDIRNKLEALESELKELTRSRLKQEVTDKATLLNTLRAKIKSAQESIRFCEKKAVELKGQRSKAMAQVERLEKEREDLKGKMEARTRELGKVQKNIDTIEDKVFGDFCASTGLKSIREYEAREVAMYREFQDKLDKLSAHKSKLTAQLEREEQRDYDELLKRAIDLVKKIKEQIKSGEERLEGLQQQQASLKEAQAEAEKALEQARQAHELKHKEVKSLSKDRASLSSNKAEAAKRVSHEEAVLERIRARAHEILQKARVEEVKLPVKGRRSGEDDGADDEDDEEGDSMDVDSGTQTQETSTQASSRQQEISTHPSQSQNPVVIRDRVTLERIDFTRLGKAERREASREEQEAEKKRYKEKMDEIQAEVERMQPNMRALERYEDVSKRVKETNEEYEQAKTAAQEANARFARVRQERKDRFMECFTMVSGALTTIYRDLTKSSKHPLGGKAFLSLDDSDEPFLGGIKYNAMPPMKRFRDMEQLSGGEKTVAALALLFAIHSYRPAPFFVMDEVDAALDNVNVRKVCTYIKERSSEFQCIVISLKDIFFENANALVGICRDRASNGSRTLTLDLDQYDAYQQQREEEEEEEEEEQEAPPEQEEEEEEEEEEPPAQRKSSKGGARNSRRKQPQDEDEDDEEGQ